EIVLSFGKPMDVLGNFVDQNGVSYDRHKRVVEVKEYFISDGKVKSDLQRETEYTRMLGKRIVERYHKENIVLSSHLIAYVIFKILQKQNPSLDLYGLLRLPSEDYQFDLNAVRSAVRQMQEQLFEMEGKGHIKLSKEIQGDTDALIKDGVSKLGIFHPQKTLKYNKSGNIESENFRILYFYHNRLSTYQFKPIKWNQIAGDQKERQGAQKQKNNLQKTS
ncbi:MAG: hypothetical protein AAF985_26635, partial [Bacteroidota bacterium]